LWTISVMWEITEVYNETKISIYLIPYSYTWFIAIFFSDCFCSSSSQFCRMLVSLIVF
jgi:hypothetical protein